MEILSEIIRGIAVVVLLYVCMELLLPKSSLQPYIRMVAGLLLIAAVLAPLSQLRLGTAPTALFRAEDYANEQVLQAGQELQAEWQQTARLEYAEAAARRAESLLLLDACISRVEAEGFYEGESLSLHLLIEASQDRSTAWLQTLSNYFSIGKEAIGIDFRQE